MDDWHYLIWAGMAATMVGLSKGGLPTVGMLSVPILSLFMSPVKAVVMLLPIYIISDMAGLWLYRKNFSAINLKILVPAGVGGVLVGWLTASLVSDTAVKMMIGLMGVGFVFNAWRQRNTAQAPSPARWGKGLFWGGLSGFTSFISHAGGPPFQVYLLPQKLSKLVFAGTSTLFFAFINLAKLGPYHQLQPYGPAEMTGALVLIPFALVGTVVGAYLTRKIADDWFFKWVQAGLLLISLKLILDVVRA
ncbi:sulfite exporter TauE/SafE family protein [Limnohabitans sp.]|uniref:sulfite exporter TauE/SafE family protein n=1 Tax=Limnohabitans sp. TaxID=1907725 RepID=UPI00333EA027